MSSDGSTHSFVLGDFLGGFLDLMLLFFVTIFIVAEILFFIRKRQSFKLELMVAAVTCMILTIFLAISTEPEISPEDIYSYLTIFAAPVGIVIVINEFLLKWHKVFLTHVVFFLGSVAAAVYFPTWIFVVFCVVGRGCL